MDIEIRIPAVGESVREAVLAQWLKNDGDAVKKEEPILVIETDKVTLEITAEADGILHILVLAGTTVPIGAIVGSLTAGDTAGKADAVSMPEAPSSTEIQTPEPHPPEAVPVSPHLNQPSAAPPVSRPSLPGDDHESMDLPPSVRRLVHEKGIDPAAVVGTGPAGRITKGDALLYLESRAVQTDAPVPTSGVQPLKNTSSPETGDEVTVRKTLTPIRRRIAERLVQAKQQTAMLTTFNEIDMRQVMALRDRYKDAFKRKHGVALGFMGFFIKASVAALQEFPEINAYIDGADILYHEYYHIGIAVGSERGLVVPVLRHADRMGFADMESAIASAVEKIVSGKLSLAELEGGTFTISNGGVYGSLLSTPILNPPQSGILGMHKIEKRPVVVDDAIVIRPMMYVALSYDHRIVDGKGAVSFLKRIKEIIEEPERLMLEI